MGIEKSRPRFKGYRQTISAFDRAKTAMALATCAKDIELAKKKMEEIKAIMEVRGIKWK